MYIGPNSDTYATRPRTNGNDPTFLSSTLCTVFEDDRAINIVKGANKNYELGAIHL